MQHIFFLRKSKISFVMPFPPALLSHKNWVKSVPPWPELGRSESLSRSLELGQKCSLPVCALGSCGLAMFGAMCSEAVKTSAEREKERKIKLQREKQRREQERELVSWLPAGFLALGSSLSGEQPASGVWPEVRPSYRQQTVFPKTLTSGVL